MSARLIPRLISRLGAMLLILIYGVSVMATETPDYSVAQTLAEKIEVRDYPSSIIAKVTVSGERDDAANTAFRQLAGFIFGGNESSEKIAMTAPVVQKPVELSATQSELDSDNALWDVHFIMPSKYNLDTLPVPEDERITITQKPAYRAVAIRFSGLGRPANLAKHKTKLDEAVSQAGLTITSDPIYAFYNAPFVPGFMRRNEVMYELALK